MDGLFYIYNAGQQESTSGFHPANEVERVALDVLVEMLNFPGKYADNPSCWGVMAVAFGIQLKMWRTPQ
ncbi:hypothetical protein AB0F17_18160 [Nonomuraea sp. NPDC026600]|uniref:hypothetical protein n=1 Tax=Nonomuraea sp. NPDC026600 TaxID=3155363 RepID=UPI0033CD8F5D